MQAEEEDVLWAEADIHAVEVDQRAHEQPRADDQQHRERDLEDYDGFAGEPLAPFGGRRRAIFEAGVHVGAGRPQGWRKAERDSGQQRHCGGEGEDLPIEAAMELWRLPGTRQQPRQQVAPEIAEDESGRSPQQRQQQALGEDLPQNASAARAERHAHAHFPLPRRRARQQQVGDVRASQQQDQPGHREQNVNLGTEVPRGAIEAPTARDQVEVRQQAVLGHRQRGAHGLIEVH